jgi:hypothetical protein
MTNLLVLSYGNLHNETLLWTLVHDLNVDPECLLVTFFDAPEGACAPALPGGIGWLSWSDAMALGDARITSVTVQSLYPANAAALNALAEATRLTPTKVSIIITDNEVDLWKQHVDRHGSLRAGRTAGIDAAVLDVLDWVDGFVCLRHPYGDILERLLDRKLRIADCMLIRRLIPDPVEYEVLSGPARREVQNLQRKARRLNIMLMTKPVPYDRFRIYMRDLLRFAFAAGLRRDVTVYLWERRKPWKWRDRLEYAAIAWLIRAISPVLSRFGRSRVRLRSLPSLTRHEYMMALMRCQAMIGQHRSGGGAINEALKWRLVVMLPDGSFNDMVRGEALDLPVIHRSRNAFSDIARTVVLGADEQGVCPAFMIAEARMKDRFWAFFDGFFRRSQG